MEVQLGGGLQTAAPIELTKDPKESEMISVSVGETTASTTPGSKIITLTAGNQVQKTIVIENFSDHPPEMQKDILNAILNSDLGSGTGGEQTVATLEIPAAVAPLDESKLAKDKVEVGEAAAFPVTVEEFQQPSVSEPQ